MSTHLLQKIFKHPLFIPCFILGLAALSWFNSRGIVLGDEYEYAKNIVEISKGQFVNTGHHFENRFGLLLPAVPLVKLFGTHYSVFFLWPFLSFIFLLYFLQKILSFESPELAQITIALTTVNLIFVRLAADVSVDLVMTMFMTLAFLLTWHSRLNRISFSKGGVLTGLSLFAAVATKMTAVFCFPFYAFLFFRDMKKGQFKQFWTSCILTGTACFCLYFFAYYFYTGDIFFRFSGLENSHGAGEVVPWNYRNRPWSDLIQRLTVYPPAFFLFAPGYGIPIILSSLAIVLLKPWRQQGFIRFTSFYFLSLTFIFWFGSSSLQQYNPVILAERMLLPILPPAAILVSFLFLHKKPISLESRRINLLKLSSLAAVFFCLFLLYLRPDKAIGLLSSVFVLALLFLSFKKEFSLSQKKIRLLLLPFFFHHLWHIFFYIPTLPFFTERQFYRAFEAEQKPYIIYTDERTAEMHQVYFDFKNPEFIEVKNRDEYRKTAKPAILHENQEKIELLKIRKKKSELLPEIKTAIDTVIYDKYGIKFSTLKETF